MGEITYQNKDVASKLTAEALVGNTLEAFGLPKRRVVKILPTNLPAIESNELRLDNLFQLEDGALAIIDYESGFSQENFVKYLNYAARVVKRYAEDKRLGELKQLKILVIYTADVDWAQEEYDLGGVILKVEASYLIRQDTGEIYGRLKRKLSAGEGLDVGERMQLMILPLTVKGPEGKQLAIEKAVELAKQIPDRKQAVQVMAGILTFADKIVDADYARKVKGEMRMNLIGQMIYEDGYEEGKNEGITQGISQGIAQGISEGITQGIRILAKTCKEFGISKEEALIRVEREFPMFGEQAREAVEQYWG